MIPKGQGWPIYYDWRIHASLKVLDLPSTFPLDHLYPSHLSHLYTSRTMQVSSLLRFSNVCPFLGHSTPASLRTLATKASSAGHVNASALTTTAMSCPMMGPQLAQIAGRKGYASVAGNSEVEAIHKVRI